jgi:hypothetical protein
MVLSRTWRWPIIPSAFNRRLDGHVLLVAALAVRALGDDDVEGTRARVLQQQLIAGARPRDAGRRPVGVGDAADPSSR